MKGAVDGVKWLIISVRVCCWPLCRVLVCSAGICSDCSQRALDALSVSEVQKVS